MTITLEKALDVLRGNREMLRARGVVHAAVFGSVARGEAGPDSDVDVVVEFGPDEHFSIFDFVRLKIDIEELMQSKIDLVEDKAMRPYFRENAMKDSIDAF